MRFFSPTEAPLVHIDILPDAAKAVEAFVRDGKLFIDTWASGSDIPCKGSNSESILENFLEEHCHSCSLFSDTVEVDLDGLDVYDSELGNITIRDSSVSCYSPCDAAEEGLSDISFPCRMGYEPEDEEEDSDVKLTAEYMQYSVSYNLSNGRTEYFAQQQPITIYKDEVWVAEPSTAINTYERDNRVCWGELCIPNNLLQAEASFTKSYANQDLCSFDTHQDNADDFGCLSFPEDYFTLPGAIAVDNSIERPKAAICATAVNTVGSFMLLKTAQASGLGPIAFVIAYLYKNVAIDDDTVIDVWATEVMPIGKRLLFVSNNQPGLNNGLYIGQVDPNFNLSPCKLTQPPSSEQAVQDSNLSPA